MKAVLEFNLPEEKNRLKLAIDSQKLQMIIHKTLTYAVEKKHEHNIGSECYDAYEDIRSFICITMNEYDMSTQYSEIDWEDE